MGKAKAKLDFIELPVPTKIQFGRDRVIDMNGKPEFATPDIPLPDITLVCKELEDAYNAAQGGGTHEKDEQDKKEKVWDDKMRKEAAYVTRIADGDVAIITLAGFTPTETEATPSAPPAKVEGYKATRDDQSGIINLTSDVMENVKGYVDIVSEDPDVSITIINDQMMISPSLKPVYILAGTTRKTSISNLTPAVKYYFLRYAFNAAGRGANSEKISIMVV